MGSVEEDPEELWKEDYDADSATLWMTVLGGLSDPAMRIFSPVVKHRHQSRGQVGRRI